MTVCRQAEAVTDRLGTVRRVRQITWRNLGWVSSAPESKVGSSFCTTRIYVRAVSGSHINCGSVPAVSRPSDPRGGEPRGVRGEIRTSRHANRDIEDVGNF